MIPPLTLILTFFILNTQFNGKSRVTNGSYIKYCFGKYSQDASRNFASLHHRWIDTIDQYDCKFDPGNYYSGLSRDQFIAFREQYFHR
jgi:hypothetical protein